jgi:hypothetical protein
MIRKGIAVGIILLLFAGTSISVAYDASIDEVPPQTADMYFLKHAFVWGTYENNTKYWTTGFQIWNNHDWANLTIHVIGYKTSESCYVHIEAYDVHAPFHLGIIGPHRCYIFAFGNPGVTVLGIRQ